MEKVVLHCDMDNYFAAVEEKYNPGLKEIPFAVCGDPAMRHSIVMSKNDLADRVGVKTGLSYSQARQICPSLGYVKADMSKYLAETKNAREVYLKYSNNVIPYGMDESWIVLDSGTSVKEAEQIADVIRIEIKYALGLSASVGVSYNYIFAKLGSDYNKPNGITVITKENYKQIVWQLPADELLFVGSSRKKALSGVGINTIGDIARAEPERLVNLLGKTGYDLWCFANGDDRNFKPNSDTIGSIGNTITPPADLRTTEEASAVIYLLVSAVSARLKKHGLKTRCVSICMRDSNFGKVIRQTSLSHSTDNTNRIFNCAFELFIRHYKWENPLRSLGVRADNLDNSEQLSMFENDDCDLSVNINHRVSKLTERFGTLSLEKSAAAREW
ncbi:MAG: DNA polymerase IV [Oscillospiraceae bacterium]|nr:DNA polymerase IV [Oscillospiraceae bacterium]